MNHELTDFLETLRADIIHSMQAKGKYATGQTAQQMVIVNEGNTAELQLPPYLQALESGRGPTGANAVAGVPPMIDRIKQWCQAKGIPDKAVWAIKKSIDKKGYKGTPGVLSEPLGNDNINIRLDQTAEKLADAIIQQIIDSISS
jgi:hypothetical protein